MGERCPQNVQNMVIRDYCTKLNYKYLLSGTEYAMNNSYLMLNQLVNEIPSIDGIALYSLFQMPEIQNERLKIYKNILKKSGEIHFALENLQINSNNDINRIENIWLIRQALPNCLSKFHLDS